MDIFIVSDIGGTQMRVAAFDAETLKKVKHKRIATQGEKGIPTDYVIQLILEVGKNHSNKAIAIAEPCYHGPEIGHVTIQSDDPICGYGHKGHLETFSSSSAMQKFVFFHIKQGISSSLSESFSPTGRDIFLADKNGDKLSILTFERAGKYLGHSLAIFLHKLNTSIDILRGGASQAMDILIKSMRIVMGNLIIFPKYLNFPEIKTAKLSENNDLMGALALLQSKNNLNNPVPLLSI